jgi:cyclopropane fatty-acyl-phospholipid synthase-like methyltransferase
MNQQDLNNYFNTHWRGQFNQYMFTGTALAKKIQKDEWVLDVGCGIHPFKSLITNLIGIDPAFPQADIMTTIEDFKTEQRFDVAFCLGSINFGTEENVKDQIKCVVNLLKPRARIYWRCNPGLKDHGNKECHSIDFFPWSPKLLNEYAKQFGFKVTEVKEDFNNRIYCEWTRSNT